MLQPKLRVARLPIIVRIAHPHFEMQMRTERDAGRTDSPQARLVIHVLAHFHIDRLQVSV